MAVIKCVCADFSQRARKRDFLDPAVLETVCADVLHAVRDVHGREIAAVAERPGLDSLERGGELDAFYRTPAENVSFTDLLVDNFLRPQLLQALAQLHAFQLLTAIKRFRTDLFHARRDVEPCHTATPKAPCTNLSESAREFTISKLSTVIERVVFDCS